MTTLQKRKAKGVKGGGQFAGVEHQYADVRLGMENVAGEDTPPIDAGIAHARFMAGATTAYAHSEALSEDTRRVFAVQSGIATAYWADLEKLHSAGATSPDDFLALADTYDAKAGQAGKGRGWTKKARTDKATAAGEYGYLARTLRKLAAGELPEAGPKTSTR